MHVWYGSSILWLWINMVRKVSHESCSISFIFSADIFLYQDVIFHLFTNYTATQKNETTYQFSSSSCFLCLRPPPAPAYQLPFQVFWYVYWKSTSWYYYHHKVGYWSTHYVPAWIYKVSTLSFSWLMLSLHAFNSLKILSTGSVCTPTSLFHSPEILWVVSVWTPTSLYGFPWAKNNVVR